ncbi:hypothetical protein Tco_1302136 [Tanacetum coccineum]
MYTLFSEMEDNDDRKSFLDYLCIDLNYVKEQRNNLMSKHRNLVQELNTCKEQLLVLKQAKLDLLTMQHCISEQNPTQKKKILGIDQFTEDSSSSRPKDLVFVKSSTDNSEVSITGVINLSYLKILLCQIMILHPLPPLEKLAGAELQSVAMFSAEAEDLVVAGCCANILWIRSQLTDYDIIYEKEDMEFHFIPTQYQLADILIKLLDKPSFKRLINELGMLNIDSKPEASVPTEEN